MMKMSATVQSEIVPIREDCYEIHMFEWNICLGFCIYCIVT